MILKRVKKDQVEAVKKAEQHLSEYAEKGYRTLCLCYRTLEADFYKKWSEKYSTATTAVPKDEKAVAELENEIETDMIFLGATAIEDKLQDVIILTLFIITLPLILVCA